MSAFIICSGLCVCTDMLRMCVLYASFGSKVRPRTFGCIVMGSAVLFILRSRLLSYSAGSGVNRVQVVLPGFSVILFCVVHENTLCSYFILFLGCIHACVCRYDSDVICVDHELNRCSGWWCVCSVNVK